MPRTLNPSLEAMLDAQNFGSPILRGWFMEDEERTSSFQILKYKINLTSIEIDFYTEGNIQYEICIERGALINGVEYTHYTIPFRLYDMQLTKGIWKCKGSLALHTRYNKPGDVTYESALDEWFELATPSGTLQYTKLNPSASWLGYQFYATGKRIILNDKVTQFLSLLQQKYLIYITDYEDLNALVFSVDDTFARSVDHIIALNDNDTWGNIQEKNKDYVWKDENGAYNFTGAGNLPTYNLGYLESTANPPSVSTRTQKAEKLKATIPFHLKYVSGDKVTFTKSGFNSITGPLLVTEIFDPNLNPSWQLQLEMLQYLTNTEGGALPLSIERVSNYMPLNVSNFNGILSESDNNVQQALETLDNQAVPSVTGKTAAPTANDDINDGYVIRHIWINETNDDAYICLNNAAGAAVWKKITGQISVVKTADETVNNSSTLQNDDELLFSADANKLYHVKVGLIVRTRPGASANDMKISFSVPSGTSGYYGSLAQDWSVKTGISPSLGASITSVANQGITATMVINTSDNITQAFCIIEALIVIGKTAGTVNFQWAQNVAGARNLTVKANSFLIAELLN